MIGPKMHSRTILSLKDATVEESMIGVRNCSAKLPFLGALFFYSTQILLAM